jgi:putative transposase
LTGAVAQRLDELVRQQTKAFQGDVIGLNLQPDHVHLFAGFPPTLAVPKIMHHLKGYASHELRQEFDWLNRRRPSRWTRSY